MPVFCTNCGASNADGTKFCTNCGSMMPEIAPVEQPVQQPVEQPVQQPVYAQQPVQQPVEQPVYAQQPVEQPVEQPVYAQPDYPQQGAYAPAPEKKSNKTKIIVISVVGAVLLIGIVIGILALCGVFGGSGGLSGTWVSSNGSTIKIDGSKLIGANGQTYKLETSGNNFKVIGDSEDDVEEYLYKLDGDTLELYDTEDTDLTKPFIVFTRQGGGGNKGNEPDTPSYNVSKLVGKWEDDYGLSTYVFDDDGGFSYEALGLSFSGTYTVSGNSIAITYTYYGIDVDLNYTFSIDGDTLYLTDDTTHITTNYTRK